MKKLIITSFFLALFFALNAQVTLEKKYDYSTSVVKLESFGYKYFVMDVPSEQCRIYNLDHSIFKTINCNIPNEFYLSDIKFISEKLFDNDTGIELLCTFYKYNTSQAYYEYDSKIINENGSQITFIDGALYNYINKTDENTYKLFSYCYNFSTTPEKVWTNIYNLPGIVVSAKFLNEKTPDILLNAFPNPSNSTVKVAYSLPENVTSGNLHLIDNQGQTVQQFIVDKHTNYLELNVSEYKSGIYHYFIDCGNIKTNSKKLVIR